MKDDHLTALAALRAWLLLVEDRLAYLERRVFVAQTIAGLLTVGGALASLLWWLR